MQFIGIDGREYDGATVTTIVPFHKGPKGRNWSRRDVVTADLSESLVVVLTAITNVLYIQNTPFWPELL